MRLINRRKQMKAAATDQDSLFAGVFGDRLDDEPTPVAPDVGEGAFDESSRGMEMTDAASGRPRVGRPARLRFPWARTTGRSECAATRPVDAVTTACPSLVSAIQVYNQTATPEYLGTFSDTQLRLYLAHLESAQRPRGAGSQWERPGDTRAIMLHKPDEEV